ncbi:conserved Plasmodium protein, unknown function [Plasmodium gallinaceum]|uniref:WD repeat-containing protein n=1 Tax=Plasmodium gallinaceum TaxID=5849 RepID=A0A1J1GUB6_PLAGA|nr:conserved Plasmodium protein, unknown function [Plasmodium gallinaceum]CRG96103.1 conserved Plasmodium protein, unknown function [Plasmodium gallinaceum]
MEIRNYLSSEDYIFELENNENFFDHKFPINIKPTWSIKGHNNSIEGIHVINENKFVTVSHDCYVSLWNLENKKNLRNIKLEYPILCSSYNKKKKYLCVGLTNKNNNICLIDIERNKTMENLVSKCNSIFCMNYFEEDKITYGCKDGSICLIDLNKKKNIYRYEEIDDCLNYCTYNINHKTHIFSTRKGNVLFFDFRYTLPVYQNNNLHSKYSVNTLFSYNNYLYSGGSDCLIKKFDLRFLDESKPLEIFLGHTSPIRFLSFSNNLLYFCSSSDNGSIKLWEIDKNIESTNKISGSLIPTSITPSYTENLNTKLQDNKSRKISKNFLELNKNIITNNRSSFIASECTYGKSSLLLKNNNKKGEKAITDKKRTLTPNVLNINKERVSVVSRNELFNTIKTKNTNKNSLNNLKINDYSKDTYLQINKLEIKNSKPHNKSNLLTSVHSSANKNYDLRFKSKINLNKSNEIIKNTGNFLNKLNDSNIKNLFHNDDLVNNSIEKTKLKNSTLSMLNHRSRVSSMEWFNNIILSSSWDQSIKCWDVKKYIMNQL